jgi:predicted nucleic acid-binding protein
MDGKISKEKIVVDTNIFLEFLLQQERTAESLFLMKKIEEGTVEAYMTGYTLHSIEFTLDRRKQPKVLEKFLAQLMNAQGLKIYQTELAEEKEIALLIQTINLDFDDTLQYFVAKKLDAVLVSFDRDFDKTDLKRVEPSQVV